MKFFQKFIKNRKYKCPKQQTNPFLSKLMSFYFLVESNKFMICCAGAIFYLLCFTCYQAATVVINS